MLKKLLSTPTEQLGKAGKLLVFQIKLWSHCARLLKKNRSGQHAAALSYHTIFGIVPLAIVMLLIFQSFPAYSGIGDNVKNLVYKELQLSTIVYKEATEEGQTVMLTDYFDKLVNNFFSGINKGSITLISVVLIIWAAFALLSTIERSFNNIWHISRGRGFLHRMINYWALVTLGPLLIGVGIYITTRYAMLSQLQETVTSHLAPAVFSYMVSTIIFFLLYFMLPNTKVEAKAAIWGAVVAALVWGLAKWAFGIYVTEFIPYSKIYGVLGLIPLGVFWIFITWLIVLFGLNLTFTTQHLKHLDAAEIATAKKTEECFIANDFTVINIVREIVEAFERNEAPVSGEVVFSELDIPAEFGDRIMDHLVDKGIIARSSEPRVGFIPAKEPSNIRLSDISEVVSLAGFGQGKGKDSGKVGQISQSVREILGRYNLKQIIDTEKKV